MSEMKAWRKEKRDGAGVPYFVLNLGDGRIHELPEAVIDQVLALDERVRAAEQNYKFLDAISKVLHDEADAEKADLRAQLAASESARQAAEQRVSELTGPFPDARSNWTKDQWKQLAYLARHRAEAAEGRAAELTEALNRASEHVGELSLAWQRGALSEHDGKGGWRSNRNADVYRELVALSSPVPAARDGEAEG